MAIDLRGRSSVSFYDTFSAFPATGSTTTLYVDRGDMVVYIWNGSSYEQLGGGSNITTVANYSALLAIGASNVPNTFYWCSSAQGTSWLPGGIGGTYYNSGLYYSNGTTWEYMNSPYQATQIEVDAGIVADKFVTPSTLYGSSKWGTKENSLPSMVGNSLKVLRVNIGETGKEWATVSGGGTIYKLTSQTLTAASWVLVGGYYTYTFSNANITTNTRVDFTPDNASYNEVTTCGMTTQVDVLAGSCKFYSIFPPQSNIIGEITIFPTL